MVAPLLSWLAPPPRERLFAVSGDSRLTPGRLSGETSYRPWGSVNFGAIRKNALKEQTRREELTLIDAAVLRLAAGDLSRAMAMLKLAARDSSARPAALNDLAAAYLARFNLEGDCLDLLRAIDSAEQALALQPASSEARFNRATALSLLGARHLASQAWREIRRDDAGDWREEAAQRIRELENLPVDKRWARALSLIESPNASASEVAVLVAELPANARAYAEEVLLPRWAAAVAASDHAAAQRSLLLAARIGESLARTRGEHLLADAVDNIRRVTASGSSRERQALLRGLQQYGKGVVLYNAQNVVSAQAPLNDAIRDLGLIDNPLRYWATLYLGIIEYYADASRGLAMVDGILCEVREERYPAIVGRVEWVAGTADKVQGRIQSSVHRYEHAAVNLRRAGGEPAAAFVAVLLAESYTLLGEHALAWEQRKTAFHQVALGEGPKRNVAMWNEAKEALLRQGSLRLAGPLVDEAVAYSKEDPAPLSRVAAYLNRSAYKLGVDDRHGAESDLRDAHVALSEMEPSALRDQMTYLAWIAEGLYNRATDPAKAAELLRRGLEGQRVTGTRFEAVTYTTALADAELAAGDIAAGAATLERALRIFEEIRSTVEDPVSRMHAFWQAQPAFDRLVDLRTTVLPSDAEEVFLLAERSRARVLLELTGARSGAFARLHDIEAALPRGVAMVNYLVLENRIIAWVIENGRARRVTLPSKREELQDAIQRFRLELKRGGSVTSIDDAAAPLYEMLIRPLALSRDGASLIVVPDRWIARLPFAALYDRRAGQYLIEQRTVTIAPSATLLLRNSMPKSREVRVGSPVLSIGVSPAGAHRGAFLPRLPYAEREARTVASIYPDSLLLIGRSATRQNFLGLSVSSGVIHFAGHAVVDLDAPRRSVLLFSRAADDTLEPLSLGELFDAGAAHARLVVLSACRTQDSLADDREGLLGLAGAFVAGGVREILASPLDVDDSVSPSVMAAFHRRYRVEQSAGPAFRDAVLDLLHSNRSDVRSPAAWGGFTVIQGAIEGGDQ